MLGVCVQMDSMIKVLNGDLEDDDVSPFLIMLIPYRVLHKFVNTPKKIYTVLPLSVVSLRQSIQRLTLRASG
jgi:hypothetical protein